MAASLTQLLNTARDSLSAQTYGLGVTGQNLANVNTPGYVRREALLETRALGTQTTGSVVANGIRRVTDEFLERRQFESTGLNSAASEHDSRLESLEALFNDVSGTGLGNSLDNLYNSFTQLSANPADPTTRRNVLAAADAFAERSRDTATVIAQSRTDLLKDAQSTTTQINESARAIARLNSQILAAEAQGGDAADLKDQRKQVMLGLASLVDVRTIASGSGIVVQASGTTLVDGVEARQLSIDLDSDGKMRVFAARNDEATPTEVTKFLTGGKLAGIKEARDVDLFETAKKLDEFVFDVATSINQQHQLGFGTDGVDGRDLFDVNTVDAARTVRVSVDVFNRPEAIAASGSATTLPGGSDNAVALSRLSTAPVVFGNSRTAAQSYGDLVGDVGQRKSAAEKMLESREAIAAQLDAMNEAMSGVSLDEEFVNLTKFQRAYEASARVLTTADQLLQELIQRV